MNITLELDHLTIGYGRKVVARDLNLHMHAGELVCLLGANGIGKSTLIRTIAGMQPALSGSVRINGADIHTLSTAERARRISLVLTERINPGYMLAYALVALGRHPHTGWSGQLSAADQDIIQWAISAVGAETLAERMVEELSDGERQKIMIARALAQDPALLILDEPTAYLDLPHRIEIMALMARLAHDTQRAVLLSTHDLDLALRYADRLWLIGLEAGEVTVKTGAPEDLVLNGAFEQVFARDGLSFDLTTGAFRSRTKLHQPIGVNGTGIAATWTRRALERAGFTPVAPENVPTVIDVIDGDSPLWTLTIDGVTETFASIETLIAALRPVSV